MAVTRPWPVRVRLTLTYVGAMLLVLAVYAAAVFGVVENSAAQALDDRLRGDLRWAGDMWQARPDGTLTWFEGEPGDPNAPWLQVWTPDGRLLHRTTHADWYPIAESHHLATAADGRVVTVWSRGVPFRILSARSDLNGRPVVVQVARSEAPLRQDRWDLALVLLLGLPLAACVAGIGGYWLARWALAPVDRMTARARAISAARLQDRLPVENPADELGRLATVVNDMLGRLEAAFGQMQRFTSDVSHELRTPLMAMRTVGEVSLRGPRDASTYRDTVGSMLEEVDRLSCLVDRLLALSRAEQAAGQPTLEPVDLAGVATEVRTQLDVLAEEKGQTIAVTGSVPAVAMADPVLLRQALTNLVDNAIRHSPDGARVQVHVWVDGSRCGLDIEDNGPGIAPERRARIFDRFYRGAEAAGGGAGLGLGIARWAVDAMGGRLTLVGSPHAGSLFRIDLPAAPDSRDRRVLAS